MASKPQRLTNDLKKAIVHNILKSTFADENKELEAKAAVLADDIYKFFIGDDMKAFEKLPDRFFDNARGVKAVIRGRMRYVSFDGNLDSILGHFYGGTEMRRMPHFLAGHGYSKHTIIRPEHELTARFDALETRIEGLNERENQLSIKVRAVLNSVTTVKRLLETWPEVHEFVPASSDDVTTLPAVVISDLNSQIKFKEAA